MYSLSPGVFKEEGQLTTCIAYYREAIRICPEFADAHSNLGNALKEQNNIQVWYGVVKMIMMWCS